ncbi:TetR family transcriptional regulator C-terminal domain-containing protein [Planctobacterium marinum]|uniref:TetR family transcriptional regulator C-terminal domain-containing protein n=1 Tax=Planctobacterium marinum TaxID=1631968 RepID=UPI002B4BFF75|nr:TetR family transcriptional regulator C-terminal domain-containing protein [Planctobacterium marinum]
MLVQKSVKKNVKGSVRQANYGKIIKAAVTVFATKGYQGATVQEVAEKAGLPKANVLYYFKSKQGIYEAVLSDILSLWNSSFDHATAQDDPAVALSRYIREKLEISRTYPEASKIFAMEMIKGAEQLSDEIKAGMVSWFQSRIAIIQQWIQDGKMANVDPAMLMFQIWATTQHYADFSAQISILKDGKMLNKKGFQDVGDYLCRSILSSCGLKVPE